VEAERDADLDFALDAELDESIDDIFDRMKPSKLVSQRLRDAAVVAVTTE
jgi:hypothetical protein